jgi:hypothetical protein
MPQSPKLLDNAMKMLWKDEVKRDWILLFITDAAPYMLKGAKECLHYMSCTWPPQSGRWNPRKLPWGWQFDFQCQEDICEGLTKSREIKKKRGTSTPGSINALGNVAQCCGVLMWQLLYNSENHQWARQQWSFIHYICEGTVFFWCVWKSDLYEVKLRSD